MALMVGGADVKKGVGAFEGLPTPATTNKFARGWRHKAGLTAKP